VVVVPVEVERVVMVGVATVCVVIGREVEVVPVEVERVVMVGITTVHVAIEVERQWWCQLKWRE